VRVADSVEGLVRADIQDLGDAVKVGDELAVVVTGLDRDRRRLELGLR